ncbi:MAG: bifunctional alpha/beta hydrolase/OsmC family protein [Alphaproteobacteria bacterium]|nr:bifunctional alpha/beta hydrolase/OsmC family protein [Alphaproteobacteria bacterium]
MPTQRTTFPGADGHELAARLDLPSGEVRGYALFAHCFTCTKDILAAKRIAQGLARHGIGVLRFDFTRLGHSEGEFANTHFSSNIADLKAAADFLRRSFAAPEILIGHSLGGAAVLAVAGDIPEVKAVATIGAPSDVGHVLAQFSSHIDEINERGEAEVTLAQRKFTIRREFIEDVTRHKLTDKISHLKKALLVMHSPIDQTVGVDNASAIFMAAKHPKSFVSLDQADHLLSREEDAVYVADIIAAWAGRYVVRDTPNGTTHDSVVVSETGLGKFQNTVVAGRHQLLADEPASVGGLGSGLSPYDLLSAALGACTSMTLRMYANHKKLALGRVTVEVSHGKVPTEHCSDCGEAAEGRGGKIDRFERVISVEGDVDGELRDKLVEIAGKCPVHKTLEHSAAVVTRINEQKTG